MRASGENVKNSTGSDFREGQDYARAYEVFTHRYREGANVSNMPEVPYNT